MKNRLKKIVIITIVLVILFVSGDMPAIVHASGSVTTITSSQGYTESGYGFGVGKFTVTGVDGNSHAALCACHEKALPGRGMQMKTVVCTNPNIRKILYYGYGGPGNRGYSYTQTAVAISVANGHMDSDDTGESENPVGKPVLNQIASLPDPGDTFTAYYAYSTNASMQDLVYYVYNPTGKVKLIKESANTSLTENNTCYSLEGAQYGVYTDVSCKTQAGTLKTNSDGNTEELELNAGTYYVKETLAPKGYALDKKIYTVNVSSGKTVTVNVKDLPQNDTVDVVLGKYDGEKSYTGDGNLPGGSATLEGAEYTYKFYGGLYDSIQDLQDETPLRTWVMRTNKNGFIRFNANYLVDGDAFWTDSNGTVALPLGTLTIQETKAPEGYCINEEIFIRKITSEGDVENVNTYNMPIVPENIIRGDIEIRKVFQPKDPKEDVLEPIEGAEFTITSDTTGEEVMKIVTDKNGKATTKKDADSRGSLIYDTYTITETKTPEGYAPVKPFKVVINQEQVTLTGIYRQDTLITSPIQIMKVDADTGKVIPQAGTTFQLLDEQKNVIKMKTYYPSKKELTEFVSDENGQILFPETLKCGTYYLREIKAPKGYLLNEQDVQFVISEEADWTDPVTVKVENENVLGQVRVCKMDEETGEALAGAEFAVIADEDIITPDGTVRVKKEEVVENLVTDENGIAVSGKLFLGRYRLKEQKTPTGYTCHEKDVSFELKYKDQTTAVVVEEVSVKNRPNKFRIVKYKKGTDQRIKGVKFAVRKQLENNENVSGDETKNEYKIYETNGNGEVKLSYLEPGTYIVSEIDTIEGFILNGENFEFTVDDKGLVNGKEEEVWKVENDYTKVKVRKTDVETGKEVPGATLQIWNLNGEKIEEWISSKEPYLIEELPTGEYILREVNAPKGYRIAEDVNFTVEETGEIQIVEMKEERVKQRITSVRTGDNRNAAAGLFFLIGSGIVMWKIYSQKKRCRIKQQDVD